MSYRETKSKYRNVRTEYNGEKYDSKFEAGQAALLDIRVRAGEIKGWERQFKVECVPFTSDGRPVKALTVRHRVDFRVHENDGTFTLLEAKGVETADWKRRRDWLLALWLPEHLDHKYQVVKDAGRGRGLRWSSK